MQLRNNGEEMKKGNPERKPRKEGRVNFPDIRLDSANDEKYFTFIAPNDLQT